MLILFWTISDYVQSSASDRRVRSQLEVRRPLFDVVLRAGRRSVARKGAVERVLREERCVVFLNLSRTKGKQMVSRIHETKFHNQYIFLFSSRFLMRIKNYKLNEYNGQLSTDPFKFWSLIFNLNNLLF